jgi:hypothetical protein
MASVRSMVFNGLHSLGHLQCMELVDNSTPTNETHTAILEKCAALFQS